MVPDVRRWRRWTWVVVAWTAVMVGLALLLTMTLGNACDDLQGIGLTVCSTGSTIGTVLAWMILGFSWLVGFFVLAVMWFARRPPRRLCPPYGHPVEMGDSVCGRCGYDFVRAAEPGLPAGG